MRIQRGKTLSVGLAMLLAAGACSSLKTSPPDSPVLVEQRRELANALIGEWSEECRAAARLMMEKYGIPDDVRYERLTWNDKGPWRRIVVQNVRPFYTLDGPTSAIEQTIRLQLTPDQAVGVAAAFGDLLRYDPAKRELSALSDREELNYLSLNLAHDIIAGDLRPEQAHDTFEQIVSLEQAGKSSPYEEGLRFTPGS
jgi:hypothetical protein